MTENSTNLVLLGLMLFTLARLTGSIWALYLTYAAPAYIKERRKNWKIAALPDFKVQPHKYGPLMDAREWIGLSFGPLLFVGMGTGIFFAAQDLAEIKYISGIFLSMGVLIAFLFYRCATVAIWVSENGIIGRSIFRNKVTMAWNEVIELSNMTGSYKGDFSRVYSLKDSLDIPCAWSRNEVLCSLILSAWETHRAHAAME